MDEKTEELRDIFMDVADSETLTEQQEDARGSLTDTEVDEDHIRSVINQMQEQYSFESSLTIDTLLAVVKRFYEGHSDQEIADTQDELQDPDDVRTARFDLHLITDTDRDGPFDLDELDERINAGQDIAEIAAALESDEPTVEEYAHLARVEEDRRLVGDKFRAEFDRLLGDDDVTDQFTEAIQETGLDEATEGLETDTGF